MAKKTTEALDREERLISYLHDSGLRVTPERVHMLKAMTSLPHLFTIDQLYEYMNGHEQFPISRATCFNNVKVLINAGILLRHRIFEGDTRYQLRRDATHCLLVCTSCGSIRPVRLKNIAMAARHVGVKRFRPTHMVSYIYGLCDKCST